MFSRILRVLLLLLAASATSVWAQPGNLDRRTPEEIRQQLNERLAQLEDQIGSHPEQYSGYEARARVYADLSRLANDAAERGFFTDKALADFAKSIELDPDFCPNYVERARLNYADFLKNFEDIRRDYLTAISLIKEHHFDDYDLKLLYDKLSYLYFDRAERLVTNPELIGELYLGTEYSAWDDFDKGIVYAKKRVRVPTHWWNVVAGILRKGDLAFKRRDYERALAAYQSDEEHLGKDYALVCENARSYEQCERQQKDMLLTFSIRRGRAYLKLGRADEALGELNVYFEKAYHHECQDIFLLRAQAHWALGNDELARADEETAKKKPSTWCPFDMQKWPFG